MASKKEVKKDIRYLTEQVIIDALEVSEHLDEEKAKKKVLDIIVEVANLHNQLISRVNHPDGKEDSKLVKLHFDSILTDLMNSCNQAYDKLNKLLPQ